MGRRPYSSSGNALIIIGYKLSLIDASLVYEALPELEELDPQRSDKMVVIAFAQKKMITHRTGKRRCEIGCQT